MADTNELPPVIKHALAPPKKMAAAHEASLQVSGPAKRTTVSDHTGRDESAMVEIPLGPIQEGFLSTHVEARLASDRQRRNLRRMLVGLRAACAKLENGRFVSTQADLIKWLLEQLG